MDTAWGKKERDQPVRVNIDGEEAIILPDDLSVVDWVRLPPELGGTQVRVIDRSAKRCVCGCGHISVHLFLGDNLAVCECPYNGFLWHKLKEGKK